MEPLTETTPHVANFIAAVRSRKTSDLAAPPDDLHKSAALAHFANISNRVGRAVYFDAATNRFHGDVQANALLHRRNCTGCALMWFQGGRCAGRKEVGSERRKQAERAAYG